LSYATTGLFESAAEKCRTEANLSNADLSSSVLTGVRLNDSGSPKNPYPLCENTRFNGLTIIDDEELWRQFSSNTTMNVPPEAKDKKELREKLEKREFDRETIDRYLSLSSLSD
jgi:hypothetical protein